MAKEGDWVGRLSDTLRVHERERASAPLPRYEIASEPRRGGMGAVYRAWDRQLGRTVALKVLDARAAGTPEAVSRFLREAELAARLTHPNIVPVYDSGTWGESGRPYLVMQFVDGDTLAEEPAEPREAARLMIDVARAVQYAHDHGVIHRDLKPQNLMRDRTGRVYVTDFGLAKAVASTGASTSVAGEILGTPVYMPPEQALGKLDEVDARSDVYALGATLYALVTGRPPFGGATSEEVRVNVVTGRLVPPSAHRPDCAGTLERVIVKAMSRSRDERHASAAAFARELETYLAESEPGPFARLAGSVPLRLALAATALAILTVWMLPEPKRTPQVPPTKELDDLDKLIENGLIERARVPIEKLRRAFPDHPRVEEIARRYGERADGLLDQDAKDMFDALASGDARRAVALETRMHQMDPERARRFVARTREWESARSAALASVRDGSCAEAGRAIDALEPETLAIASRGLADEVAARLARQPGDDWIGLLRRLAPGHPQLRHVELSRLRARATKSTPLPELREILAAMRLLDRENELTGQVQVLVNEREGLLTDLERFERLLKDALDELAERDIDRMSRRIEDAAALAPRLGDQAQDRLRAITAARNWLANLNGAATIDVLAGLGADGVPDVARPAAQRAWTAAASAMRVRDVDAQVAARKLQEARLSLHALESLSPTHAELPRLRSAVEWLADAESASQLVQQGKLEDARRRIDALRRRDPRHPTLTDLEEQLHEGMLAAALPVFREGRLDAVVAEYARLADGGALTSRPRRERIAALLDRFASGGDDAKILWTAMLGPADAAVLAHPDDPDVRLERWILRRRLGQIAKAGEDADRAVALRPDARSLVARGQSRYLGGDYRSALADFEQATELAANDARATFWRAATREALKDPGAPADYVRCLDLKHDSPIATVRAAAACLATDRRRSERLALAAIAAADRLSEEDRLADPGATPNDVKAAAHYVHGQVLMLDKDWRKALAQLRLAEGLVRDAKLGSAIANAIAECLKRLD